MNAVECENLVKAFGRKHAVGGLTVRIGENRITGLIGRNGAGKTTFLKLAAGYLRPTGGSLRVFGKTPFNSLAVSGNLIFVDDAMAFPQSLTLGEILKELPRFYPNFDSALAQRLFDYYGFDKRQRAARLSKGQRSSFNAIAGIAARAALTIFDEPTAGMDAAARKDFYRALLKEYIAFPRTVILSSHLLGELSGLLEDIVLIDEGKLCAAMTADEAACCAVGLRGKAEMAEKAAGGRRTLHREEFAGGIFLVVQGALSPEEAARARETGVELLPVAADDLCIYLTQKREGGIDDALRAE
jgi:ABC-type multidrug transport system, ATPase component